ncbi:MlaD family protein [Rhodoferax sp. OV413]|uniref:MlaD family protein n=1 Tax=Rhodoferax sp. OV413 TaxID=1855285 RepID=UPI0025E8695B|nr:MlaD family protein [Rhodoferax sp. OV413]
MENKSHAFAAGAFVLLLLALLTAMAVWLTRDTTEQRVFEISSPEGVAGLQPQAAVRYKGVLVGRVISVGLDPQEQGNVLLRIAVNEAAPVTRSTFAALSYQGVTGLAFVQLDDKEQGSPALESAGDALPRIPMRAGMVSRLSEQGGNLLTQLEQASVKMNSLLADDNQKQIMGAIGNLSQAAANLSSLSRRAEQALGPANAPDAVNLPQLAAQTEATLKTMQATAERLSSSAQTVRDSAEEFRRTNRRIGEPGGTLDKISQSTDALAATSRQVQSQLLPRLNRTVEDAGRTVRQVGRSAESLGDQPQSVLWGRGTHAPGPGEPGFVTPAALATPVTATAP